MKKGIIQRVATGNDGTFGVFIFDGRPVCVTCENPWKRNARVISCIPNGAYRVTKFSGTRYKDVWQLHDVPNRNAILIHAGNTEADTDGCLLMGSGFGIFDGRQGIVNSARTIGMLRTILPSEFVLTVKGLEDVIR